MAVLLLAGGVAVAANRRNDRGGHRRVAAGEPATTAVPGTTTEPPPSSTAAPPAPAPNTVAPPVPSEEARQIEEIKGQVAQLRGLSWKGPLDIQVVSRAELAKRVVAVTVRDRRPDRIAGDGEALKVLQLLARDADYAKTLDDLYAGAVIGFYDPRTKQLLVAGASGGKLSPATRITVAHELLHALTDQNFGFGPKTDALDAADRQEELSGYISLLEGDAKLLEGLWAQKFLTAAERRASQRESDGGADAYARVPRYLRDSLLFPYITGLEFVTSQYRRGGFAAVDAVYRNPPTSTEQVLHPELYAARQGWVPPALPPLPSATGCALVRTGNLGEFTMEEVLNEQLPVTESDAAAQGWNGDTFNLLRCGTVLTLADRWVADDEPAAARLAAALTRWAKGWSASPADPGADGRFSGPRGSGRVTRNGVRVDLVLADDLPSADRVAAALG